MGITIERRSTLSLLCRQRPTMRSALVASVRSHPKALHVFNRAKAQAYCFRLCDGPVVFRSHLHLVARTTLGIACGVHIPH